MNIKKLILSFAAVILLSVSAGHVQAGSWGVGIKVGSHSLDTGASDDIDNNGSVDSTKTFTDKVVAGSIFVERNFDTNFGSVALGVNYIPVDADIDKREISQSSQKALADGAATTGTNAASGTVKDHYTIYVQPGFELGDNLVYLNFGLAFADITGKSESISSTNLSETKSLEGTQLGIGLKRVGGNGGFVKLEYSQTDYDQVSWVTSNDTKGMADLDDSILSISLGKQF